MIYLERLLIVKTRQILVDLEKISRSTQSINSKQETILPQCHALVLKLIRTLVKIKTIFFSLVLSINYKLLIKLKKRIIGKAELLKIRRIINLLRPNLLAIKSL